MALTADQVQQFYIGYYARPADPVGLAYWQTQDEAAALEGFSGSLEFTNQFVGLTSTQKVTKVYNNLLGRAPDTEGLLYWAGELTAGRETIGTLVLSMIENALGKDVTTIADRVIYSNAFTAALNTAEEINAYGGPEATQTARDALLKVVSASVGDHTALDAELQNIDATISVIVSGGDTPVADTLTVGIDNLVGNTADNVFSGPVVQNQNGELVNTLETGDRITGGAGTDTLNAVLTDSQNINNLGAPAISATLSGVEVVNYRAQYVSVDGVNGSNIDAELHSGVQQYWSNNSRADVQIEDVRQLPEELTFGMRQTDPGASYRVYFDPAQLAADRGAAGNSSLTLTLVDNSVGANELENFPVNGVVFTLGGTQYTVQSVAMGEADTYVAFVAALEAALAEQPALAGVTVTLNANNTITLTDPAGAAFGAVGYTWVGNIVPSGGELQWNQSVGAPIVSDAPITTNVVLDAVGRFAQGGTLDIGSMADGGVEVFNVSVDRSSWLDEIASTSNMGDHTLHQLETVNLTSIGANGDLIVGDKVVGRTGELDGRVVDGLFDVREVLDVGFQGDLSYGVTLTSDSVARYLDNATGEVLFTYEGGNGQDNITIEETGVSGDPDFAMDVALGAGDDRLNLAVETVNNVSIDGGTGANTLAVSSSHGTTAANTFEGFANFQTYEVEGSGTTQHGFTSMQGVTQVNIATTGTTSTTLIDLAADAGVLITGKNQTLANTNAAQNFGTVSINGAEGSETTVTLQNTARINGGLTVGALVLGDASATNISNINTLNLVSAGQRETSNTVTSLNAERVGTFNLSGTQDLEVTLDAAARSTATAANRTSLAVDATELTGDLDLTVNATIINNVDEVAGLTVNLTGTTGQNDLLLLDGNIANDADTSISAFEIVGFSNTQGVFDATSVAGVERYEVLDTDGALELNNLRSTETVNINVNGGAVSHPLTFVAAGQSTSSVLNVTTEDMGGTFNETTISLGLRVQDYRTLTVDLAGSNTVNTASTLNLTFLDEAGLAPGETGFDAATVYARTLNITGGVDNNRDARQVDTLNLGNLQTTLTLVDVSAYNGEVSGAWATTTGSNAVIAANAYAFTWNMGQELGTPEIQVLDFDNFGDLAVGESLTITFAGGSYTFTNNTVAAIAEDDLADAIIADAAAAPAQFTIADNAGAVQLTSAVNGDFDDAVITASNLGNTDLAGVETTQGVTGEREVQTLNFTGFGDLDVGDKVFITFAGESVTFTNNGGAAILEADLATEIAAVLTPTEFNIVENGGLLRLTATDEGDQALALVQASAPANNAGNVARVVTTEGVTEVVEVQTVNFTGFGDLAVGANVTINFAGGTYTFTNATGAAIAEADLAGEIILDAANAPVQFAIADNGTGLVQLTATAAGDQLPAVITAGDRGNDAAAVTVTATNGVADVLSEFITTFSFGVDAYEAGVLWTIDGFQAFNDAADQVGLDNLSILDLSDLGVAGLADVVITQTGADTHITSNGDLNFTIVLTGVTATELSNENFNFA